MSKISYLDIQKKINNERRLFEKLRTGRHQWVKLGSLYSNRTSRGGGEGPAWAAVLSKYTFFKTHGRQSGGGMFQSIKLFTFCGHETCVYEGQPLSCKKQINKKVYLCIQIISFVENPFVHL